MAHSQQIFSNFINLSNVTAGRHVYIAPDLQISEGNAVPLSQPEADNSFISTENIKTKFMEVHRNSAPSAHSQPATVPQSLIRIGKATIDESLSLKVAPMDRNSSLIMGETTVAHGTIQMPSLAAGAAALQKATDQSSSATVVSALASAASDAKDNADDTVTADMIAAKELEISELAKLKAGKIHATEGDVSIDDVKEADVGSIKAKQDINLVVRTGANNQFGTLEADQNLSIKAAPNAKVALGPVVAGAGTMYFGPLETTDPKYSHPASASAASAQPALANASTQQTQLNIHNHFSQSAAPSKDEVIYNRDIEAYEVITSLVENIVINGDVFGKVTNVKGKIIVNGDVLGTLQNVKGDNIINQDLLGHASTVAGNNFVRGDVTGSANPAAKKLDTQAAKRFS